MLSSVEVWRVGLCALSFDGAQDDTPAFFPHLTINRLIKIWHSNNTMGLNM
jgi:hypothetical protein